MFQHKTFGAPVPNAPDEAAEIATRVVQAALTRDARIIDDPGRDFGWNFIRALHGAFQREYAESPVQVFSRTVDSAVSKGDGRKSVHEMLYDLSVIEWGVTAVSPGHSALLPVFGRPLWQVESERATSTRAVAFDLGKLVQGCAPNKLLITCERQSPGRFNRFLFEAAQACDGRLFVAYIPDYDSKGHTPQGIGIGLRGLWIKEAGGMRQIVERFRLPSQMI